VTRAVSIHRIIAAVLLAWLAVIGFDVLLHGGALARLYHEPHAFLLPPETMFRRVPLGYLAFLVIVILIAWLMLRLGVRDGRSGAIFGLKVGAMMWGALALGLASVSTAQPALLLGWFVGESLQTAIAGGVLGIAFAAQRLGRLTLAVIAFVIACAALTIVLQSAGLAPAALRLRGD
jgi:hypothetical protein